MTCQSNKMKKECKNDWISVIVLSYNSEKYIYDAIDSILLQDYPFVEVIIADDGSKNFDDSVIEKYINNNNRGNIVNIVILHNSENVGTVKNINNAMIKSSGEFIKIIAGDDTYPSNDVFSKQINDIKERHTVVSVGMLQQCNEKMEPIEDNRIKKSNESINVVLSMDYISARKYITANDIFPFANQAMCYRRDFFINGGLCDEDYRLIEDTPLALRVIKESGKVSVLPFYSVNHRAKVGISTSRELFAPRRLYYYADGITYSKKEVFSYPEIYGRLYRIEHLRMSTFVYKMANAKKSNRIFERIIVCIQYFDSIIYYSARNSRKVINRLKDRFFSK